MKKLFFLLIFFQSLINTLEKHQPVPLSNARDENPSESESDHGLALALAPKSDYLTTHTAHGVVTEPHGRSNDVEGCPRVELTITRPCKIHATMQCDEHDRRVIESLDEASPIAQDDRLACMLHLCAGRAGSVPDLRYGGQLATSKFLIGDSVSLDVELPEPGCFTLVPKPVLHGRGQAEPLRVTVTVECTDLRSTVLGVSRARQGGGLS